MKCDVIYEKGQTTCPKYVPNTFAGGCRIFPQPLKDGREPRLLGYQTSWINDDGIMLIAEKSRQIGWTWASAFGIARRHALKNYNLDTWGTSRDDLQAKLAVRDCKAFANVLHAGAKDLGNTVINSKGQSAHVLSFANNTKYYSLSSNPDAQAGKRGNRVADEFALNKDNRQLYSIMEPGVTWGGFIWIFSTHRGSANYHNRLICEAREDGNPKGFKVYRVTLQDALDCGFLYKLQSALPLDDPRMAMDEAMYFDFVKSKAADAETFAQEYMCCPMDDASAFVSYDIYDAAVMGHAESHYSVEQLRGCLGDLYLGVDIGRTNDLTCFWVIEVISVIKFTRSCITLQNARFAEQESVFYELMDLPNLRRACVDQSGIGRQFAERGTERYGHRCEGVNFTGPIKEQLAYPLKAGLEDKTFRVPPDRKIEADFRSIRKETTAAGNVRFAGERTANGHSDRFWAAGLANHAAARPSYIPLPSTFARTHTDINNEVIL